MKEKRSVQYTVRDISEDADNRLRESAAAEDISLNQAVLRALDRGLGLTGESVRYRSLRGIVAASKPPDRKAWAKTLGSMDRVDASDWK